jgi:DnaJ-class molecular chaperone
LAAPGTPELTRVQYDLLVSLEELYKGCVKLVNHNRRCVDESGNVTIEQRSLAVDIKPGLLDGTRFVFQG